MMKSELVEQVIIVKPYGSEEPARVCFAVQHLLLPDDVDVVEQDNCMQEEAARVSV